ncbi:uncharacterized protein LOC107641790 [Arachis ipaensis]|uniref:uncharacterized protein LOC107641790 n=1 Tax=Arachis ipaensis TaxID=130454 RepID=UPI0007AF8224|nr:uncharacterized protein LOC107641790 [Arachis ipaensis]XP_025650852.1 uncharacterized protein LOC112746968 [Arachis hypogaea]
MKERGECVTEQGKLARVRSVATVVASCTASFVAPRHHHRRRTTMESLPSNRRCELLSSLKQNPMRRERETKQREEREKALRGFLPPLLSLPSPPPESRAEVGKETIFPVAVAVTALLLLRFIFLVFLNYRLSCCNCGL